jgi:hypothetical protein
VSAEVEARDDEPVPHPELGEPSVARAVFAQAVDERDAAFRFEDR